MIRLEANGYGVITVSDVQLGTACVQPRTTRKPAPQMALFNLFNLAGHFNFFGKTNTQGYPNFIFKKFLKKVEQS